MTGTEKQVAWATKIKNEALATIDANIELNEKIFNENKDGNTTGNILHRNRAEKNLKVWKSVKTDFEKLFSLHDDAKFYIDNRHCLTGEFVCGLADERVSKIDSSFI